MNKKSFAIQFLIDVVYHRYTTFPIKRMSRSRKTKPVMIRMEDILHAEIKAAAIANDLTVSDIVRLAIRQQIPAIRSGKTKLQAS